MTDGGAGGEDSIGRLLGSHVQAAKTTVLTLGIGFGVHGGPQVFCKLLSGKGKVWCACMGAC